MIICAALRLKSSLLSGGEIIIPCHRHGDGYAILYSLNSAVLSDARKTNGITEGFIDQTGTFYDRAEAYKEALACGQIPEALRECKIEKRESVLYSEDLY